MEARVEVHHPQSGWPKDQALVERAVPKGVNVSADDWNKVLQTLENWKKTDQSQRFGQYLLNNCPEFCGPEDRRIFYAHSIAEVFEELSLVGRKEKE